MTSLLTLPLEPKKVLVDPHPFWGGWVVAIIAGVIFLGFSVWIVVQRVRSGQPDSVPGDAGQGGRGLGSRGLGSRGRGTSDD